MPLKPRNRELLDKVLVGLGAMVTVVLIGAGGLAAWGYQFAGDQISSQLVQEKVFFPEKGNPALDPKEFPGLQQYAGQQVDTGDKAKAYADEYIWVHMMKVAGGKTYAEVSAAAKADPTNAKLAAQKTTLFQGDMLRSSLLTAYAFSRFGLIAYYGAIVAFVGAALMAVLVIMGIFHIMSIKR
jgi:hypothetical protein